MRERGAGWGVEGVPWEELPLAALLPGPGTCVGGFVLGPVLGEGGYGTVYLAERGGRRFAVKFLALSRLAGWACREVEVMLRLEEVGGVGLEGHGRWPEEAPRFLFIAMRYVPGEELRAWARHHNPDALGVADVLLALARQVSAVHAVGVVHRDIKGDNVLVREDGGAVLVDFGVATFEGARRMTGPEVPGCRESLSPEALRFHREARPGERYPVCKGDDLWALGVMAYGLLTAVEPFRGRTVVELERAILHDTVAPPHVCNPRVPRALGEVCGRLLEKAPEARYPDADALVAALEEARRGADATWTVPLCEAWAPDAATTPRDGALTPEARRERWRRLVEYEQRHPRRGRPPLERTVPGVARRAARRGGRARTGLLLMVGLLAAGHPRAGVAEGEASVPSSRVGTQEVALVREAPEGGAGAVLDASAATPAPPPETRVKTTQKDSLPQKARPSRPESPSATASRAGAALLLCSLATGCPGRGLRTEPPPGECPTGAADAMRAWGLHVARVSLTPSEGARIITVSEGPVTVELGDDSGRLVAGSTLSGSLLLTPSRVYGRFTHGRMAGSGETIPVCMEFVYRGQPGAFLEQVAPSPGSARIYSTQRVMPVERFP